MAGNEEFLNYLEAMFDAKVKNIEKNIKPTMIPIQLPFSHPLVNSRKIFLQMHLK